MRSNPLDQASRALEVGLSIILGLSAAGILALAVLIMVNMDAGSRGQGGRFYVALAALAVLGAIDSQFRKLVKRRAPFSLTTTPEERRYALVSLVLLLGSAALLIGLAWLLPQE